MTLRLRRWRRRLLITLAGLLVLVAVGYGVLAASTSRSQLARAVIWGKSDVHRFHRPLGGGSVPLVRTVRVLEGGRPVQRDLERFLAASHTTALLILRGGTLLYEGYSTATTTTPPRRRCRSPSRCLGPWSGSPSTRAASARSTTRSPAMCPSWPDATAASARSPCGTC
jgi:hypothetical protein